MPRKFLKRNKIGSITTTARKQPVMIDHEVFPHILERIIDHCCTKAISRLRNTSKHVRDRIDDYHCQQLVVENGCLRPIRGGAWLQHGDARLSKAIVITLPWVSSWQDDGGEGDGVQASCVKRSAPYLTNLRLIRVDDPEWTVSCQSLLINPNWRSMDGVSHRRYASCDPALQVGT